jgi:SSS family solute:Na+ symporter
MVGMMGIGFSIGFAQSHFELGAIFGLMVLCYGFLPVYRKLNVYTLSEYLGRRYDERSRLAYAVIMIVIMVVVQMVPGLYIGARSICVLMGGDATETVVEISDVESTEKGTGEQQSEQTNAGKQKRNVNQTYYNGFVIALAVIAAGYTIFGGLKAVIWTDVIQSVLLLAAGIGVAVLTFQRIGGWAAMMALDQAGAHKMGLYLPMNHPDLPWTGVFTGLMALHCFYWGTNQFIVQRALAAKSDAEARLGIVAAGFLKLLIPFFAIASGVAAFYLFQAESQAVDPDAAFPEVVKLVVPIGTGIVGLIAAGLIGAILSSIDSMMNSAATIVTVDVYKRHVNPEATDRQMILVGRISIVVFVTLAALMAILVLNPNSTKNFFLQIVDYSGYLTPGLLVVFLMGMFWRRGTGTAAVVTILAGIVFSGAVELTYNMTHGMHPAVYSIVTEQRELSTFRNEELPQEMQHLTGEEKEAYLQAAAETELTPVNVLLGARLNFFHRVVIVLVLCVLLYVAISLQGRPDAEKSRLTWTDLGGHATSDLKNLLTAFVVSLAFFALLGWVMVGQWLSPSACAWIGAGWTLLMFARAIGRSMAKRRAAHAGDLQSNPLLACLREDRFWAAILCAIAVFMHYYFY